MIFKRIPPAATPISLIDCLKSFSNQKAAAEELQQTLQKYFSSKYVFFSNSGIASFYLILKVLKDISRKLEVILPAYTAPALILPLRKLGLKPVLCDISLDDFNLDLNALSGLVSNKTLCIVYVYMFGIVSDNVEHLKNNFSNTFIVEDCAQGMGGKIKSVPIGRFGDISFFSFNRGKNLPTYGGGCIITDVDELAKRTAEEISNLKALDFFSNLAIPFKLLGLSLAVRPFIYGAGYPFISHFKDTSVPEDFKAKKFTDFQANLARELFKKIENFSFQRYQNGMTLIEGLKSVEGLILPRISNDSLVAFNRLPVVFKDIQKKEEAKKRLFKAGIDASQMYERPLHLIFDLGYKQGDFPNAEYLAKGLLTLPSHPLVNKDIIATICNIVKNS